MVEKLRVATDGEVLNVILQASTELKRRARPAFWDLLDGVIRIYGSPDDTWCMFKDSGRFVCEITTPEWALTCKGDTPIEAAVGVCAEYRVAKDVTPIPQSNR